MPNTSSTNNKVVLFSTNKIKAGLFKDSFIIDGTVANQVLGAYFEQPSTFNFEDFELLREQLQQVTEDSGYINDLLEALTNPVAREGAEVELKGLLQEQQFKSDSVTKPIYTVGENVYAVNCLDSPNTDGRWIKTLCNCIASLIDSNNLEALYMFLHASDISGEEDMGEAYKEFTSDFYNYIQDSELSAQCDLVRIFLFHHVDNEINSILENCTANEAASVFSKIEKSFKKDNTCKQNINDIEKGFVTFKGTYDE